MQQANSFEAIDPNAVTAQTAGAEAVVIEGAQTAPTYNEEQTDAEVEQTEEIKLGYGEQLIDIREGNNKKWRDPAKIKRIKKIAAASRRRNRRK